MNATLLGGSEESLSFVKRDYDVSWIQPSFRPTSIIYDLKRISFRAAHCFVVLQVISCQASATNNNKKFDFDDKRERRKEEKFY